MAESIIFLAVFGSVLAGLWDLKTTEVPDEIPALMIALGVFYWFMRAAQTGDAYPLYVSVATASVIGVAGYILYKTGKWGGADGFVFAAIAAMVPVHNGRIFIGDYAANFLLVSVAYMVAYTIVLGLMKPYVFRHLFRDLRKTWIYVAASALAYFSLAILTGNLGADAVFYGLLIIVLAVFWRYAVMVERKLFRKKIPVSMLRPGVVLEKMIWRGLTKEEIREIKRKEKYVVVKEGVRFVPVFPLTLVVTLIYGNVLFLIFPF